MNYQYFKNKLMDCINGPDEEDFNMRKDEEYWHPIADDLICQIAIAAANKSLTIDEVAKLVELYQNVPKWYA